MGTHWVLAELGLLRILEQGLELFDYPIAIELGGSVIIVMCKRHIGRLPHLHCERYADKLRLHIVKARCVGIEGKQFCCLQSF